MSKAWVPFYFATGALLGYLGHLALDRYTPARTCPQLLREAEHAKFSEERVWGYYREERARAEEFRAMAQELLRELRLPDDVPELPPQRHVTP
jgi:hypothetical protein